MLNLNFKTLSHVFFIAYSVIFLQFFSYESWDSITCKSMSPQIEKKSPNIKPYYFLEISSCIFGTRIILNFASPEVFVSPGHGTRR